MIIFTVILVPPWGFWLCSLPYPLHPGNSGYVHCRVIYVLEVSGKFHSSLLYSRSFWLCPSCCLLHPLVSPSGPACYSLEFLIIFTVLPVTPQGFWLCPLHSSYFHWTSLFTAVFLVMAHFCACIPTVQYYT